MKTLVFFVAMTSLAGCKFAEVKTEPDHHDNLLVKQEAPRPLLPAPTIEPDALSRADFARGIESIKAETQSSNNAIQQGMNALVGASVAKVAEKLEANAVKASAELNTQLKAVADINVKLANELHASFSATLKAQAEVHAQAIANLKADVSAKLDAVASAQAALHAQVGMFNRSDSTSTSAGRDNVVNSDFTKEVRDTVISLCVPCVALAALCVVALIWFLERSRGRSERLAKFFIDHALNIKGAHTCSHD